MDGRYSGIVLSIRPLTVTLADKYLGLLGCGILLVLRLPTIWSIIVSSSSRVQQSCNDPSEHQELLTQLQNVISKKVWILSNIAARIANLLSFLFSGMCMSLTLRLLTSYIYMERIFLMFLDHTQRRTTIGRTPLDDQSARRRDLYLTTQRHSQQTNIHAPGGIRTHDLSRRAPCGRSPAEIVGSNPTGGMDVFLLWVLCVVR